MKKISAFVIAMAFVICSLSLPFDAFALSQNDDISKTQLGSTNTYYEFIAESGTLIISGQGETPSFSSNGTGAPWYEWRNDSITNVIVEEGITTLGNYFLFDVYASSIELPVSLRKIGNYALSGTINITQWDLPFGVTNIGAYAFANNSTLTEITIPDTVTTINSRAFVGCSSLEEIVIPYSVKSIGIYTFDKCNSLESVVFQSLTSTISIGSYCFYECPALKSIAFPSNATLSQYCFGYKSKSSKYPDTSMTVYNNSSAYSYAVANNISYTIADRIPMECGVSYYNTFNDYNVDDVYCFEFTAIDTEIYNFYSLGECDITAELTDSQGNTVAQNDDISATNRNFMISTALTKDEVYYLYVSSVRATGDYTVIVYPDLINSLDVLGGLSLSAGQGDYSGDNPYFDIADEMMKNYVLTINFNDGYSDKIYYFNGEIDNKQIAYDNTQQQSPFSCGDNTAVIKIGNTEGEFNINISHSYNSEIIDYTADNDGYTLNTCVLCSDSYKENFVETPAITITGSAYLKENKNGAYINRIPYTHFSVVVEGREYPVEADGSWHFNTLNSCTATLVNENGENVSIDVDFEDGSHAYGDVVMQGYDFNNDGVINGKDYAIYVKGMKCPYGIEYMNCFAKNMS